MKIRLQKLIAQAGLASRRKAESWIEEGLVTVNGDKAQLGDRADLAVDQVMVNGQPLKHAEQKVTVMLNKPRGYVSTLNDPEGRKLVSDLIIGIPERLFPIGRLDYNTEGLLLLTNDGDLAQGLSHPRYHVDKTYLVKALGELTVTMTQKLENGIELDDGKTAPAKIENIRGRGAHSWFEITIHEGRNRQVRRMCDTIGLQVLRLKRIRQGFLTLGTLPTGQFRALDNSEIARLKEII
jgi:23S rRNA pseudouridine2605 synthase